MVGKFRIFLNCIDVLENFHNILRFTFDSVFLSPVTLSLFPALLDHRALHYFFPL